MLRLLHFFIVVVVRGVVIQKYTLLYFPVIAAYLDGFISMK